jgi:hypothetical protein
MSPTIRRAIACLASLTLAVKCFLFTRPDHNSGVDALFSMATVAVPLVAAALIWSRRMTAQLLVRGAWWSMLLASALVANVAPSGMQPDGAFLAGFSALALLAAGGVGLDDHPGFAPVAFRGTLLVALVLAIADTGAFTWFGTGNAVFDHSWSVLMMVPPMIAGVIGLLRLKTWGLVVGFATNAAIAVLAFAHVLNLGPLRDLFIATAVLQLLVPMPMIVAMIRRQPARVDAWRRTKAIVPVVVVVAIAGIAIAHACLSRS